MYVHCVVYLLNIKSFFNKKEDEITPVVLEPFLAKHLRPHQKTGIIFLYECVSGFKDQEYFGAILADEMGLGKTLQTICLVWYVYIYFIDHNLIHLTYFNVGCY